MSLLEYKQKRHFNRTPEPAGKEASNRGHSYVIQKHRASHLHYDFRLELDGVLKSWAVPKGPCLDPSVKRLAMQVEDHPVEYGSFEGTIPQGEYGGGTVMLWDRGSWEPIGDAREGYRSGKLKFILHGKKLQGGWMLVRTRRGADDDHRQWLLFKERDDEARPLTKGNVLDKAALSVASGRDLDEIAMDEHAVWGANKKTTRAKTKKTSRPKRSAKSGDDGAQSERFAGVRLTSPEKVLYPEHGITRLELARYYQSVAEWMLPCIEDRPLVLVRCPDGRGKACFFQKHPGAGSPQAFHQIPIKEKNKTENYVMVDDVAGLISLAQIGALEVHAWGSRADKLENPDRMIFDLDPAPDVSWPWVVQSARQVRGFLEELRLESFVKTTGGKGLHIVVPIDRKHDWNEVKEFCKAVAALIVTADPEHYTSNMSKAARPGKIFIDYLRNARGATSVAPYSPRAKPGAPISVPITWSELSPRIRSDHYTLRNIARRLASLKRDPWRGIASTRQSLTGPQAKLTALSRKK
jgi:bifunctional non-homologous end joining protein LigD